jgi:hypothetical protein
VSSATGVELDSSIATFTPSSAHYLTTIEQEKERDRDRDREHYIAVPVNDNVHCLPLILFVCLSVCLYVCQPSSASGSLHALPKIKEAWDVPPI